MAGKSWPAHGRELCVGQRSAHRLNWREDESSTAGFSPEHPVGQATGRVLGRGPGLCTHRPAGPQGSVDCCWLPQNRPSQDSSSGSGPRCTPHPRPGQCSHLRELHRTQPPGSRSLLGSCHPGPPGLDAPFALLLTRKFCFKKKNEVTLDGICHVRPPGRSTTGTPDRTSQRETKGHFSGQEGAGKLLRSLPGEVGSS